MFLHLFRPFLRLSLAFLLPLSVRKGEHGELSTQKLPVFHPKSPIFAHFLPCFAACLARHPHLVPFAAFFSPSAVGDRSETHKFHLLMHHILRRRCDFPPSAVAKSRHFSPSCAPRLVSHLLRFQNSPSTRPIPPHTSIFSDRLIRKFPLSRVINPTFPPLIGDTFSRHDTKAHDSHNNSMLSLPFCHSNSTFVV